MEASSSSWHLDDQMKKTTGDNLGVVGKNTEALLKEMAVKVFNQKQLGLIRFICYVTQYDIIQT